MHRFLGALLVLVCLADIAVGQVRPVVSSLESFVGSSGNVCVGYVTNLSEERYEPGQNYSNFRVTVETSEVLKGRPPKTFTYTRYTSSMYREFKTLMENHQANLWYQRTTPYRNEENFTPTWGSLNTWNCVSMEYKVLDNQKDIVRRIKDFVKQNPGIYPTTSVMSCVPVPIIRPTRGIVDFIFPICPSAEKIALKIIDKPHQFVPTEEPTSHQRPDDQGYNGLMRREAMFLLANFKSNKNAQILQKYLNDSSVVFSHPYQKEATLWYWVRTAAYEVLKKWDVKVDAPADEAPVSSIKSIEGLLTWPKETRLR